MTGPSTADLVALLAGHGGGAPDGEPPAVEVPAASWAAAAAALAAAGATYLDFLAGVDGLGDGPGGDMAVVAHLATPDARAHLLLRARLDRDDPHVATIADLHPGAAWHEREAHEMLGIVFDGNPDLRPLLLDPALGLRPLRRDTVLAARQVRPWPGGREAGHVAPGAQAPGGHPARRRTPPPGVVPGWVRGQAPDPGGADGPGAAP